MLHDPSSWAWSRPPGPALFTLLDRWPKKRRAASPARRISASTAGVHFGEAISSCRAQQVLIGIGLASANSSGTRPASGAGTRHGQFGDVVRGEPSHRPPTKRSVMTWLAARMPPSAPLAIMVKNESACLASRTEEVRRLPRQRSSDWAMPRRAVLGRRRCRFTSAAGTEQRLIARVAPPCDRGCCRSPPGGRSPRRRRGSGRSGRPAASADCSGQHRDDAFEGKPLEPPQALLSTLCGGIAADAHEYRHPAGGASPQYARPGGRSGVIEGRPFAGGAGENSPSTPIPRWGLDQALVALQVDRAVLERRDEGPRGPVVMDLDIDHPFLDLQQFSPGERGGSAVRTLDELLPQRREAG